MKLFSPRKRMQLINTHTVLFHFTGYLEYINFSPLGICP